MFPSKEKVALFLVFLKILTSQFKGVGGGSRVKSQIFDFFVLGDSPHQGDFKMGSTTSQLQAVQILWPCEVREKSRKSTRFIRDTIGKTEKITKSLITLCHIVQMC